MTEKPVPRGEHLMFGIRFPDMTEERIRAVCCAVGKMDSIMEVFFDPREDQVKILCVAGAEPDYEGVQIAAHAALHRGECDANEQQVPG